MKRTYRAICPWCHKEIVSNTRNATCECGMKIYIRKWTRKDVKELLSPVFEFIALKRERNQMIKHWNEKLLEYKMGLSFRDVVNILLAMYPEEAAEVIKEACAKNHEIEDQLKEWDKDE